MPGKSPKRAERFTIADQDAVRMLIQKLAAPGGSRDVDQQKLLQALDQAAMQYRNAQQKVRQAFFHGLLTGYGVGLKHR
jgi:hypothetical protein